MPRGKKTRPYTSLQLKATREQVLLTKTQLLEMATQVLQAVLGVSRQQAMRYYNETAEERGSVLHVRGIEPSRRPRKIPRRSRKSPPV